MHFPGSDRKRKTVNGNRTGTGRDDASFPFELFLDYGSQIRARAFSGQTFLVQQCNGKECYLPTKKAEEHGHYSAMIASGTCGHEAGDLLVRQVLKDISQMFDGDCRVYEYKE